MPPHGVRKWSNYGITLSFSF